MYHRARRKLAQLSRINSEKVVMIDDTMETDIRGAIEAGLLSYLVLSGSTPLESVRGTRSRPLSKYAINRRPRPAMTK